MVAERVPASESVADALSDLDQFAAESSAHPNEISSLVDAVAGGLVSDKRAPAFSSVLRNELPMYQPVYFSGLLN